MRLPDYFEGGEVVPSVRKEECWQVYLSEKDRRFGTRRPTSEELMDLHLLMTPEESGIPNEPEYMDGLVIDLYTLDRPDTLGRLQEFMDTINKAAMAMGPGYMPNDYFEASRQAWMELCKKDTEIEIDLDVRGKLRKLGTRSIKGGPKETVYHSHQCMFPTPEEIRFLEDNGGLLFPMTCYYGISTGLPEAYWALCRKYDEVMGRGGTDLNTRLMGEALLQSVGTRVLHPFWDGNGRAFGAHIALMLEREGIPIKDYDVIRDATASLSAANNNFMMNILLPGVGLKLISGSEHIAMRLDPVSRKDYMGRLLGGIAASIEAGVDRGEFFSDVVLTLAAWAMKRSLIRYGLVEPTRAEKETMEAEKASLREVQKINPDIDCTLIPPEGF